MTDRFTSSRAAAGLVPALLLMTALTMSSAAVPAKLAGKITKVDIQSRTLTFEDATAGALTLQADEKSVIVLDGDEQATLDDLFEGDEILSATVRELPSGKLLLIKAAVTSQPATTGDDPGEDEPPKDEAPPK